MNKRLTTSLPEPLLWLDDHRGVYIPRDFANCFLDRAKAVQGVSDEDWTILETGPDHEWYWEAWDDVLRDAIVTETDGTRYTLYQVYTLYREGALWLIPEGMEWDARNETFVWPTMIEND